MRPRIAGLLALGRRKALALLGGIATLGVLAFAWVLQDGDTAIEALPPPPPVLLSPAGTEIERLAPILIAFAAPPASREARELVLIEPRAEGVFVWLDERRLLFQPSLPGLQRGGDYRLRVLGAPAGLPQDFDHSYHVLGQLEVVSAIPADGDREVPLESQILVQFNRSVAPLTALAAADGAPLISFAPELPGRGEWLNTSLYRFVSSSIAPSTTYEARIAAGVAAATDAVLAADHVWRFSTIAPALASVDPGDGTQFVEPLRPLTLTFNQPMARETAARIEVLGPGNDAVRTSAEWREGDRVLVLRAAEPWRQDSTYRIEVPAGLPSGTGASSAAARSISFTTLSTPRVVSTSPPTGATNAQRFQVSLTFNQPVNLDSVFEHLTVSGEELKRSLVFQNEQRGRNGQFLGVSIVNVNIALKPSTDYEVTLAPGAVDRAGLAIPPHAFRFRTGELPSSLSIATPSNYATFSSATAPEIYVRATNLPSVRLELVRLEPDEARQFAEEKATFSIPLRNQPMRAWTMPIPPEQNKIHLVRTALTEAGPLPPGQYLIRVSDTRPPPPTATPPPGRPGSTPATPGPKALQTPFAKGTPGSAVPVAAMAFSVVDTALVTKVALDELLVWALEYETGRPLEGVAIAASGPGLPQSATARTDRSGLASFRVPPANDAVFTNQNRAWTVTLDDRGRHGIARTTWSQGAQPWQIGIPIETYPRSYVGFLYLDRPIYRPGETVYAKGVVRADDDASYSVPSIRPATLNFTLQDSRGRAILSRAVDLNDYGTFAVEVTLPGDAATGAYRAYLEARDASNRGGGGFFSLEFSVSEFRVPEFEVTVSADRADYIDGDTIEAAATARFFFGGALEAAPTRWSVFSRPRVLAYQDYPGFSFSAFDRYRPSIVSQPSRSEVQTTTGADGMARFSERAVLSAGEGTQEFQISATVTDQNSQMTAASTTVVVHPASVHVGLRPAAYVATAGRPAAIRLVTLRIGGFPAAQQQVTLRVYEREWITTKEDTTGGGRLYRSEPRDTLVQTLRGVTGDDAEARIEFVPARAGSLYLVAEAADERGRVHRSSTYLWVSGEQAASWRVTNDDTVEVVADRDSYSVGDVAEVFVPVPFPGSTALVTIERGHIIERSVQRFDGSSVLLRVPIEERHLPNVFVSVAMYRPPGGDDALPRYKVGYANLHVSTATRALEVTVRPDHERAGPGERVRFDIEVRDHLGRPAQAEVSLAVVDKAVLSLAQEVGADGRRAFWFERGLGVLTASSLAVSIDRTNDVISEQQSGGKGDGGEILRKDFRNTALWEPLLRTDAHGRTSAEVILPDNLTTWRAQARAIGLDARFGEATAELLVTRPLIVRPALPRFLRVGDELQLRAFIRNGTLEPFEAQVTLEATGVEVSSPLTQTVRVGAESSAPVEWSALVPAPGSATITITALRPGGVTDAVSMERPIYFDDTLETMATGGVVEDQLRGEGIYLPEFALTHRGGLEVEVRSSIVGALEQELWRFAAPRYRPELEGAPSIASRVIATVGAYRSRPGAARPNLDADIAKLVQRQRSDGGFAFCSLCDADPHATGWVLLALADAAAAGNQASVPVVAQAAAYINRYLGRAADVEDPSDPNERAFLLYAVQAAAGAARGTASSASADEFEDVGMGPSSIQSRMRALVEQDRGALTNAGRAYLLLGLRAGGAPGQDSEVRILLNDLTSKVIPSANGNHWEHPSRAFEYHGAQRTTALVLRALAAVDPRHPLIEETARWLSVATESSQGWGIDGASRIAAFGEYAALTQERAGAYDYQVRLESAQLLGGRFDAEKGVKTERGFVPLADLGAGRLRTLTFSKSGPGRLHYSLNLRYPVPATESEALNRGFAISHEYSLVDAPGQRIRSARLGETVRVKVTVMTQAERQKVVLHDLLPAGLEPLDPTLRTTSPAVRQRLEEERRRAIATSAPSYYAPWFGWYFSPWRAADLRDDRLTLYADRLPAGVHEYTYLATATTPGTFLVPPPVVEESPFPEVFGRGDADRFTVTP